MSEGEPQRKAVCGGRSRIVFTHPTLFKNFTLRKFRLQSASTAPSSGSGQRTWAERSSPADSVRIALISEHASRELGLSTSTQEGTKQTGVRRRAMRSSQHVEHRHQVTKQQLHDNHPPNDGSRRPTPKRSMVIRYGTIELAGVNFGARQPVLAL
mgnify:CR=1 FL=1